MVQEFIIKNETIVKKERHNIKHSKDNALEEKEKEKLLEAIRTSRYDAPTRYKYEVLVLLMMEAGLRISEALQVRLDWFVETEGEILLRVPDKARDLGNMKRDWKPKTKAGKREVVFINKGIGEKVRAFFINNKGIGLLRQRGYAIVNMFGKQIGQPLLHPHALRSTYANSLVYAGVNATTLMYYMGWSNLNVALNYIKASNVAARRDIIEKMRSNN